MSEIAITFFMEELKMKRRSAVVLNTGIAALFGTLCALSFGCLSDFTLFGLTLFNFFDTATSNVMLPLGGMIISVFVGWKLDRSVLSEQMTCRGATRFRPMRLLVFLLRWVCPVAIGLIFAQSIGIL